MGSGIILSEIAMGTVPGPNERVKRAKPMRQVVNGPEAECQASDAPSPLSAPHCQPVLHGSQSDAETHGHAKSSHQ